MTRTEAKSNEAKRPRFRWPLPMPRVVLASLAASIAASLATLTRVPLLDRVVTGVIMGMLVALSVWVWRRTRATLGFLTTWALLSVLWGAILGVIGFVNSTGTFSERAAGAVSWAGGGALVIVAWALLVIPPRYLWRSQRAVRGRLQRRRAKDPASHELRALRARRAREKQQRQRKKAQRRKGRR